MKLNPLKNASIPKYAVALAAAAAAVMLTGCRTEGDVQLSGVADSSSEPDTTLVRTEGETAVETEPGIDGVVEAYSEPDDALVLDGEESVVELDGDVAVCPNFETADDAAREAGLAFAEQFKEGFAKQEITLEDDNESLDVVSAWKSTVPHVKICFFDGSAEDCGVNNRDMRRDALNGATDKEFEWGFAVDTVCADGETYRIAYVDTAVCDDILTAGAEEIAEDMLS